MLKGVTIGCGFFSRIQMESWKRVTGAEITAACDLDVEKVTNFASDFGLRAYTKVEEMLDAEKPDFVDIATRPATHLPLVELTIGRTLPTLCQKPMADAWEEACNIAKVARRAGVRLMMNENWRWQAWYRKIGELISSGAAGAPYFYQMQTRNRDGIGEHPYPNQPYFAEMPRLLVIETLVHHIDTARFLTGDIEEVYCQTERLNPRIQAEDFVIITLRHTNGVRGVIDGNRAGEPDEPGAAMENTRVEGMENTIRLRHSGDVWLGAEKVFSGDGIAGYRGDSCRATEQHFVDCLASGAEFESEAGDYLNKTVATVEACYRSAAENRPVRIEEIAATSGV
jgi:predicted dehydrogenase